MFLKISLRYLCHKCNNSQLDYYFYYLFFDSLNLVQLRKTSKEGLDDSFADFPTSKTPGPDGFIGVLTDVMK